LIQPPTWKSAKEAEIHSTIPTMNTTFTLEKRMMEVLHFLKISVHCEWTHSRALCSAHLLQEHDQALGKHMQIKVEPRNAYVEPMAICSTLAIVQICTIARRWSMTANVLVSLDVEIRTHDLWVRWNTHTNSTSMSRLSQPRDSPPLNEAAVGRHYMIAHICTQSNIQYAPGIVHGLHTKLAFA
jgi:hypothetical protein